MKNKIIIFGVGYYGKSAYQRLKSEYEILFFADNNKDVYGTLYENIYVIKGDEINQYIDDDVDVVICSMAYYEIASQLNDMGIQNYYVMLEGFLYHCDMNEMMAPVELCKTDSFRKSNSGENNILFMQNVACTRTHKIARAMKNKGYKVFLLYTVAPPYGAYETCKDIYENMWGFTSANGIFDFVNESDFDLVHCSNEPNILVNIVRDTNKIIINDTHDMESLRGDISIESLVLEYLANCWSSGNIYVTKNVKEIAQRKYSISQIKSLAFNNYVEEEMIIDNPLKKLSAEDGNVHCVYEGAVVGDNKYNHRYFDEYWKKITEAGVHIHFYSGSEISLCKRLEKISPLVHYEGNMGGADLIHCMTQYDCGLALFNSYEGNRLHLENTSINKVYEYINAGLPILSYGINSLECFLKQNNIGFELDLKMDIRKQIESLKEINIPKGFLTKNKFTMCSNAYELINYYEILKGNYT